MARIQSQPANGQDLQALRDLQARHRHQFTHSAFASSMNPPTRPRHRGATTSTAPCRDPEAVKLEEDPRGSSVRWASEPARRRSVNSAEEGQAQGNTKGEGSDADCDAGCRRRRLVTGQEKKPGTNGPRKDPQSQRGSEPEKRGCQPQEDPPAERERWVCDKFSTTTPRKVGRERREDGREARS